MKPFFSISTKKQATQTSQKKFLGLIVREMCENSICSNEKYLNVTNIPMEQKIRDAYRV